MHIISQRFAAGVVVAVLSLGLSRTAVAQAANTARVQKVDSGSVQKVNATVYRAKEPMQPPQLLPEIKVRAHAPRAVWIAGYWDMRGDPHTAPHGGWVWVPGRWVEPPVPGARWDPGHWAFNANGAEPLGFHTEQHGDAWWAWIPGHWDDRPRFHDES
jgi:WXXGXW repeat (2 copies)